MQNTVHLRAAHTHCTERFHFSYAKFPKVFTIKTQTRCIYLGAEVQRHLPVVAFGWPFVRTDARGKPLLFSVQTYFTFLLFFPLKLWKCHRSTRFRRWGSVLVVGCRQQVVSAQVMAFKTISPPTVCCFIFLFSEHEEGICRGRGTLHFVQGSEMEQVVNLQPQYAAPKISPG